MTYEQLELPFPTDEPTYEQLELPFPPQETTVFTVWAEADNEPFDVTNIIGPPECNSYGAAVLALMGLCKHLERNGVIMANSEQDHFSGMDFEDGPKVWRGGISWAK